MNVFTIIVVALLGAAVVYLAVGMTVAIVFNVKAGIQYREKLAMRLNALRLNRMLGALGIDTNQYLHDERVVDIEKQMSACSQCANTGECDEQINKGEARVDNISYCNNEKDLRTIAKES